MIRGQCDKQGRYPQGLASRKRMTQNLKRNQPETPIKNYKTHLAYDLPWAGSRLIGPSLDEQERCEAPRRPGPQDLERVVCIWLSLFIAPCTKRSGWNNNSTGRKRPSTTRGFRSPCKRVKSWGERALWGGGGLGNRKHFFPHECFLRVFASAAASAPFLGTSGSNICVRTVSHTSRGGRAVGGNSGSKQHIHRHNTVTGISLCAPFSFSCLAIGLEILQPQRLMGGKGLFVERTTAGC